MRKGAVALCVFVALFHDAVAATRESAMTEAEQKMFTAGSGYEAYMGRWSRLLAVRFVDFAGIRNGQRVLDVGTGTGALATAVHNAAPASEVVGIDPSQGFIAFAAKSSDSALVSFEVGDAQQLRFEDASFDHAMALLVMNFIPDHDKAVAEMRRVTRAGGSVSACVWDYNEGMQSLRYFWDEVVAQEPHAAGKDERNMKLSRQGQLGALWKKAGLTDVEEQPLAIEQRFKSFEDYWGPFRTGVGPGGAYVVSLPEEQRRELEARMRTRLLGTRADGPFALNARAWCVRGRVPGK